MISKPAVAYATTASPRLSLCISFIVYFNIFNIFSITVLMYHTPKSIWFLGPLKRTPRYTERSKSERIVLKRQLVAADQLQGDCRVCFTVRIPVHR